jgi:hypothetical protein
LLINPGGYLLLERTDDATVSDLAADLLYTGGLSNSGERLTLRDALGGVIDTANGDGGVWPAGDDGLYATMERVNAGPDTDGNWRTHSGAANGRDATGLPLRGTPRNLNSLSLPTPTPQAFASGVLINEFLPAPGGGAQEFIELINTSSVAVDLSGWVLDDADGGSAPRSISGGTTLQPGEIRAFDFSGLNNDGDSARLLFPDGRVADSQSYGRDPGENVSWARLPDGGSWSDRGLPSPGAPNVGLPDDGSLAATKGVPIGTFRQWPAGAWATLTGRVTAFAPIFGKRVIYIQDETGGIAVYLGRGEWPVLELGQRVTALGYSRRQGGQLQFYVRNRSLVSFAPPDGQVVAPRVGVGVNADTAGSLVTFTGRVVRLEPQAFWLDSGSGPTRVFFARSTGLRRPKVNRGQTISVTGIVVAMAATRTRIAGYQLQPRFIFDLPTALPQPAVDETPVGEVTDVTPTEEPTETAEQ